MEEKPFRGTLNLWTEAYGCIFAEQYPDPNGFVRDDGVRTSRIVDMWINEQGHFVETLNSIYQLGTPGDRNAPDSNT